MIDFNNAAYAKLSPWDLAQAQGELQDILITDEVIHLAFKGIRDSVTFTNRRLIALNVQGITGKKKDYTSLPYSKIQAFPSRRQAPLISTRSSSCGSAVLVASSWSSAVEWTSVD